MPFSIAFSHPRYQNFAVPYNEIIMSAYTSALRDKNSQLLNWFPTQDNKHIRTNGLFIVLVETLPFGVRPSVRRQMGMLDSDLDLTYGVVIYRNSVSSNRTLNKELYLAIEMRYELSEKKTQLF